MVAELDMIELDTQVEGMEDPHPATLSYINTILGNLRQMLADAAVFTPHEIDSIVDVIGDELRVHGAVNEERLATGLYAKSFSRKKSKHIAEVLTR